MSPHVVIRPTNELATVLGAQGIGATGPAFVRYAGPPGEVADLDVGFPTEDPVVERGEVHASTLPPGRVAQMIHAGAYDELGGAWGRLGTWIAERGLEAVADRWEVYVTEPHPDMDSADLRTALFWTVRPTVPTDREARSATDR